MAISGFVSASHTTHNDGKMTTAIHGTIIERTEGERVAASDLIIVGDVQSVRLEEEVIRTTPFLFKKVISNIEIKPTQVLKGTPILNANGNIWLQFEGGETENYRTIAEYPTLMTNDKVFMVLSIRYDGSPPYSHFYGFDTTYVVRHNIAKNYQDDQIYLNELVKKYQTLITNNP